MIVWNIRRWCNITFLVSYPWQTTLIPTVLNQPCKQSLQQERNYGYASSLTKMANRDSSKTVARGEGCVHHHLSRPPRPARAPGIRHVCAHHPVYDGDKEGTKRARVHRLCSCGDEGDAVAAGIPLHALLPWHGCTAWHLGNESKKLRLLLCISLGLHYFALGEDGRHLGIKNKSQFILCFSRFALSLQCLSGKGDFSAVQRYGVRQEYCTFYIKHQIGKSILHLDKTHNRQKLYSI